MGHSERGGTFLVKLPGGDVDVLDETSTVHLLDDNTIETRTSDDEPEYFYLTDEWKEVIEVDEDNQPIEGGEHFINELFTKDMGHG